MPLPAVNCANGITPDVVCDTTWLMGERIRTVAFDGLCTCDCETAFRSYTTIGTTIEDPLGDSLIITLVGLTSAITVNQTITGATPVAGFHRARFLLELRDNGWPTIERDEFGNYVNIPDSVDVNAMSKHSQSHGEKMYRSLANATQMRTLFPSASNPHVIQEAVRLGEIVPLQPQGIQVGWTIFIDVPLRL